jgi:hypothetical protein
MSISVTGLGVLLVVSLVEREEKTSLLVIKFSKLPRRFLADVETASKMGVSLIMFLKLILLFDVILVMVVSVTPVPVSSLISWVTKIDWITFDVFF